MANVDVGWDAGEALDRWEKIRAEEAENKRRRSIVRAKETLPDPNELAQELCERVAVGELLITICEDEHLPSMRQCNRWLQQYPEFNQLYQSAIQDRLKYFEEEVIKIADDMRDDFKTIIKNGQEKRVPNPEMVARAKLRIEVRFRHLRAGRPQRWGEVTNFYSC